MDKNTTKFNFFIMFKDGFKRMTLGKTLWALVIIKLIITFLILKPFFFPNFLDSNFDDSKSKGNYVGEQLYKR